MRPGYSESGCINRLSLPMLLCKIDGAAMAGRWTISAR